MIVIVMIKTYLNVERQGAVLCYIPLRWNLIPVSIANAGDANPDADDYLSGLSWSRVYGYDNATNKFSGFDPAGSETLTVGKGYWIFLKAAGTLVP